MEGMNLGERIVTSNQIKWIILADFVWVGSTLVFLFKRKHYKTDVDKHYQEFSKLETDAITDLVTELSKDYDYDRLR